MKSEARKVYVRDMLDLRNGGKEIPWAKKSIDKRSKAIREVSDSVFPADLYS